MNPVFDKVMMKKPEGGKYNLSHTYKCGFRMGEMIPILSYPLLPGDRFDMTISSMLRFIALISPVYHEVTVNINAFVTPERIMYPGEYEDFITGAQEVLPPPIVTGKQKH